MKTSKNKIRTFEYIKLPHKPKRDEAIFCTFRDSDDCAPTTNPTIFKLLKKDKVTKIRFKVYDYAAGRMVIRTQKCPKELYIGYEYDI